MSPEVVPFKERPGQPEYFTVDLNSEKPFDPNLFDMQAKLLGTGDSTFFLKYVVIDDVLYGFDFFTTQDMFYNALRKNGNTGKLQSAGMITVDTIYAERKITGNSITLSKFLPIEDSDNYKMTVMKEKLGDYFDIEIAPPTRL